MATDEVMPGLELDLHERTEPHHTPPVSAWTSFIGGCVSGMAAVVVGQPFDTVKIRLQTSSSSLGAVACVRNMVAREGPLALFKGMVSPLATASLVNAVVFVSYNESMKLFIGSGEQRKPTYSEVFWGGAIAGVVQCSVHTPAEVVKCRLQMQSVNRTYQGPWDCVKNIMAKRGIMGMYQGLGANIVRDLPAFATYFALYEMIKDSLGSKGTWPLWASSFTAGAVAGAASWVICYPVDVIKSMIQIEPSTAPLERRSFLPVARRLLAEHGYRVFFNGMGVTILRALPVNGVLFPVYELTVGALQTLEGGPNRSMQEDGRLPAL